MTRNRRQSIPKISNYFQPISISFSLRISFTCKCGLFWAKTWVWSAYGFFLCERFIVLLYRSVALKSQSTVFTSLSLNWMSWELFICALLMVCSSELFSRSITYSFHVELKLERVGSLWKLKKEWPDLLITWKIYLRVDFNWSYLCWRSYIYTSSLVDELLNSSFSEEAIYLKENYRKISYLYKEFAERTI